MRDRKNILVTYAFYDRTWIRRFLENQAEKGWLLEEIGSFCWRFARIAPQKLRYAVTYFPKADPYASTPSEEAETFREFCAHDGWILAASSAQMQIFYSRLEDPVPIETDPVLEIENIHKSMKKSTLPGYWLLLAAAVLQILSQLMNLTGDPLSYLSQDISLFFGGCWVVLLGLGIWRLACYYRWRGQAMAAAEEDGVFLESRSTAGLEAAAGIAILVGLAAVLFGMDDRRMAVSLGAAMLLTVLAVILIDRFRRRMIREGNAPSFTKSATAVVGVVLMVAFVGIFTFIATAAGNTDWEAEEPLPLTIGDLMDTGETEYAAMPITHQESVLLGYLQIFQVPEGDSTTPSLRYDLVEVKADFLYTRCLEELMAVPSYMEDGGYRALDPAPWGAERVWQLHDGSEFRRTYIVCYEDTIVKLMPDWDLTQGQMAAMAGIFG